MMHPLIWIFGGVKALYTAKMATIVIPCYTLAVKDIKTRVEQYTGSECDVDCNPWPETKNNIKHFLKGLMRYHINSCWQWRLASNLFILLTLIFIHYLFSHYFKIIVYWIIIPLIITYLLWMGKPIREYFEELLAPFQKKSSLWLDNSQYFVQNTVKKSKEENKINQ